MVVIELVIVGVFIVMVYKLGWLIWVIICVFGVMKVFFISLVNIVVNEMLVFEFVQICCCGDLLVVEVFVFFDDLKCCECLYIELVVVIDKLCGEGDVSENVVQRVCELLGVVVVYWCRLFGCCVLFFEVKELSLLLDIIVFVFGDVCVEIFGEIWFFFKGKFFWLLCQFNVV